MESLYQTVLNQINTFEMPIIETVQETFRDYSHQVILISEMVRPDMSISVIFPLLAIFNSMLAAEMLFANILGNWSNVVLKWVLNEDRPYWWVPETSYKGSIDQYGSVTCETGPGSPSGHLTTTAVTYFILVRYAIKNYNRIKTPAWIAYLILLISVTISRIFVAAHFPHQCVLGAIFGIFFGYATYRWDHWKKYSRRKMISITALLAICAFAIYWIMKLLKFDPKYSVKLAFKWCESPEYIHVQTTPFYGLVIIIGLMLGFALIFPINRRLPSNGLNLGKAITVASLAWAVEYFGQQAIPTHSVWIFYSLHFILSVLKPVLFLYLLPKVAKPKRS